MHAVVSRSGYAQTGQPLACHQGRKGVLHAGRKCFVGLLSRHVCDCHLRDEARYTSSGTCREGKLLYRIDVQAQ